MKKMACLILLMFLALFCGREALAVGGAPLWTYNTAVADKQETRASTVDSQGNVILAGYTGSAVSDYYVAKVLATGAGLAWPAKTYDKAGGQDIATAVAVDGNDDIIVTGYVHNGSNYDIHTIKYNGADGSVIWQHSYNGAAGGNDYANAIAVDSLNNIYVGGTSQNASAEDDFILIKYVPSGPNPDGTPTWASRYNGPADNHDRLTNMFAGIDGVAVIGESQNATVDFDYVVAKYDFDGAKKWEYRYNDTGDGKGMAVSMDASGNVVATGYIYNGSNRDGYTVKLAAVNGTPIWFKPRNRGYDDEGRAIWLDEAGNAYVAGSSFTLTTNKDLCLTRYAAADGSDTMPSGWHVIYNTSNGNNDVGTGIVGDNAGDLFVTSITNDNAGGFDDIYTYKYSRTNGTRLWQAVHGTLTKHDRPVGINLASDGHPIVGGWSDTAATSYDFIAVKYNAGALDAPTALTATFVPTNEIALAWSDNAGNEENFVVERKSGAGDWTVVVSNLPANTVGYTDTGLVADTRYFYRVKATNTTDGSSPWSNEANARTTQVSYTPPTWQHGYAGPDSGDDEPAAIAVGPDNHPVVTGFSFSTEGGYDYYTRKLDRSNAATTQWSARHNDEDNESDFATAVTVDSSNRVVVSGYASMYGGGASNTNDVYTLGYPSGSGTPTWADQYNGPAGNDDRSAAVASAVDGSDNVVVVGYGKNASLNDDIYVIKYNAAGARQWAATPYNGGGLDQPAAVAFDSAGDIFVAGKTWNGSNFDYFVAKYNGATGALAWGGAPKIYNGAGSSTDYATDLAVDGDGNLVVTGYSVGAGGNGNILTLKYDGATGSVMAGWPQSYDGGGYDTGVAIEIDRNNNDVVVAGTTFIGAGNNDIVVLRYPSTGVSADWTKFLDFTGSDEAAAAMAIDRTGVVCVAGTTDNGSGDNIVAVMFDYTGLTVGASVFNGVANGVDFPADVAFNAYGEAFIAGASINAGNNTDFIVFKAISTVMQTPYPLTATQLYTQTDLAWADNSLNETGFRIERKVDGCADAGSWTPVTETAANATTYLASGLNPGSTYCFRVQSFNDAGEASRWAEVEVNTAAADAPDGLTATVQNTTDILLQWNDHTASETGFTLQRCMGAGCNFSTFTDILIPADTTSYVDNAVCENQTYRYRINAYRTSQWVTDYSAATGDKTTFAKQAPSVLATDWVSEEWVELKWTDNSSDETEFRIERCTGSGCSDFAPLATLASPAGNVLRMRMDEASWPATAGAVKDLSGAGNNGTAVNGATTTSSGKYAYAGSFDGSNDYVSTALTLNQTATGTGASFAAWVYPNSVSADNRFVIGTDNGGNDWSLLRNGATWWVANGVDAALVNTGVAADVSTWQHLVVTFNPASGVTLYKNGVSAWSNAAIAFDTSTAAVQIGRRGSLNQEFFDGRMDEVAVFTRPLTLAEAQALYNHGLGRYNDRTVAHSTTYRYQVKAYKGSSCDWTSDPSTPIDRTTTAPAPTGFTATVVDSGRVL
ncbi:LamG-like jellyroll fold domain-containing protein, partial [Trichloromonas sp.]|uniref:LamG-like jellyroll fold domain-containing protein n=1 Tax=Trichloromonas sp. TaxID=3069249 RepID=UPI003D81B4B1